MTPTDREAETPKRRTQFVVLDDLVGSPCVHIVWALSPGDAQLLAICTTDAKADHYVENFGKLPRFSGHRFWKERVVLDHGFGFKDSVLEMTQRRYRE